MFVVQHGASIRYRRSVSHSVVVTNLRPGEYLGYNTKFELLARKRFKVHRHEYVNA